MSPVAPTRPSPSPRRPRVSLALAWPLGLLGAAVLALAGVLWSLHTSAGTAWWLARWPGLQVTAPQGALFGDFSARRLRLQRADGSVVLEFSDLGWRGLSLQPSAEPGAWLGLQATALWARRLDLPAAPPDPGAPPSGPLRAPERLGLPLALRIDRLDLDTVQAAALGPQPLRHLHARLALQTQGQHRLDDLRLEWDQLQLGGAAQVATEGELPLALHLTLAPRAAPPAAAGPGTDASAKADASAGATPPPLWQGELRLDGPLHQPRFHLQWQAEAQPAARGRAATPAAHLQAQGVLQPFAAWPLQTLSARWQALDLAQWSPAWPRTRLDGQLAQPLSPGAQGAELVLALANAAAGRWSDGALPLRQLDARLALDAPADAGAGHAPALRLQSLQALLGAASAPAGQLQAQGVAKDGRWTLQATLAGLQPARLDARAPAMVLAGDLQATGAGEALGTRGQLSGQRLDPRGRPGPAVQAELDATLAWSAAGGLRLDLGQLRLRSGDAQAQASGQWVQAGGPAPLGWQAKAQARLTAFDPFVWWPGPVAVAARGPSRLDATAELDARYTPEGPAAHAPAAAASRPPSAPDPAARPRAPSQPPASATPPVASTGASAPGLLSAAPLQALLDTWARRFSGRASLRLAPGLLAGVPVAAEFTLVHGPQQALRAQGWAEGAGNRLAWQAQHPVGAGPARPGEGPSSASLSLQAPALPRLAPLWRALGGTGAVEGTLQGEARAAAQAGGAWHSDGQLSAYGLRAGPLQLADGSAQWRLAVPAGASDAPLQLQARLAQARWGGEGLDSLVLDGDGSLRAHQLTLLAKARAWPGWARLPGAPGGVAATPQPLLQLRLQGGLAASVPGQDGFGGWHGQLAQLELGQPQRTGQPWLQVRDQDLALAWPAGRLQARLAPGQAEFQLDAVRSVLRWQDLSWQAAPEAVAGAEPGAVPPWGLLQASATLEPVAVAPLLARLQPEFGWGGDLRVGARLAVHSQPSVRVDIVLERQGGDLQVTDESGTQALGLSTLRLGLSAENGVWNFTQAVAGSRLGVGAGALVARTSPQALWPEADAPLQGVLELRVAELGAWSAWVPPGWRLGGQLATRLSLGGRLGAPELTGQLQGSALSARNLLEGVQFSDGEVAVQLRGEQARIERFTLRAGQGTLRLSGGAELGAAPSAQLQLVAERFQVLGRVDLRLVASGQARLQWHPQRLALDGRFVVDEGLIDLGRNDAPSLAGDVVVLRPRDPGAGAAGRPAPGAAAPAREEPRRTTLALQLGLGLGEQLRLRGRGLDTRLQGELQLSAPGGALALQGTVQTVGGHYAAYGQKLDIDRGAVRFTGAVDNPRLDIEATRPNLDLKVGVAVTGTAASPRVRLFSEPEMSEVDKLSWLVLGRASTGLGRTDTALLQRAALALLAGEDEGVTDRLTRAIGLDQVSIRQSDGEVRETFVTLGKQLSKRLFVGYERGLNATEGTFQLIYRIAQRFSLRAQSGREDAVDLVWTWRWE